MAALKDVYLVDSMAVLKVDSKAASMVEDLVD
jgi:hypothetical protein